MKSMEYRIPVKNNGDCAYVRGFYDIHAGVRSCDFEKFQEDVEEVRRTPNMYAFLGGDMCDFISPDDRRFDVKSLTHENILELNDLPLKMARQVIDVLMPIRHKLIFGLEGNHEKTLHDRKNIDITSFICTALKIPNLGYTGICRLNFETKSKHTKNVILYASHGFGSALKFGGKINRLIDCIQAIEADIYWMGHNHGKGVAMADRLYLSSKGAPRVLAHHKVCVLGGTYLRTMHKNHSSYAERRGYVPAPIGCMTVKIVPFPVRKENKTLIRLPVHFSVETSSDITDEIDE